LQLGDVVLHRKGFSIDAVCVVCTYGFDTSLSENYQRRADSFRDGTIDHMQNFFECIKSRKDPNAPVETGVAAARAGQMVNLVYRRNGQT
jgi:hypothetical protein